VPPALLGLTFRAALSFATGGAAGGALSARALTLAIGAVKTMTAKKIIHAALLVFAAGFVGIAALFGAGAYWKAKPGLEAKAQATAPPESLPEAGGAAVPEKKLVKDVAPALELTLSSDRAEYRPAESVNLTLAIKNNGEKDFSHLLYKITHLFDFAMTRPDGREVVPALNPIELEYASTPVNVSPGKAVTITTGLEAINLPKPPGTDRYMRAKYYPMESPGTYRLRFTVAGVASNELKIKVLEKDHVEKDGVRFEILA